MNISSNIAIGATIIGLVVGLLTGIFGVGGGFLMTPALMVILGDLGPIAVGTNLVVIFANSSLGMFHRKGTCTIDIKLGLTIAVGSVLGVLTGSYFLELLENAPKLVIFGKEQETVQYSLIFLFLVLLVWIAGYTLFDYKYNSGKAVDSHKGLLAAIRVPPYFHFPSLNQPEFSIPMLLVLGFGIGTLTGLMGIGGVLLLPALIYLVGQQTNRAVGTSLLLVWISSLVGVVRKAGVGHIHLLLLLFLLVGGLTGTFIGTKIGLSLPGLKIRLYFIYVVIAAMLMVGYKLYVMTF